MLETFEHKGVVYGKYPVEEPGSCEGCSLQDDEKGCRDAPTCSSPDSIRKPVNLNLTSNTKVNNMKNLKFQVETTTTYKLGKFKADSEEKLKIEVGNAIVVHLAKTIQQEDYDNEFMDALLKYYPDTFRKIIGIIADDLYEELQHKI